MEETRKKPLWRWIADILGTIVSVLAAMVFLAPVSMILLFALSGFWPVVCYGSVLILPSLVIGWIAAGKRKKQFFKYWGIAVTLYALVFAANVGVMHYDESITIDTAPAIDTSEYLPFQENSKIIKLNHPASLQLTGDLPIVDGAAAVFPVYSAFVNATYPDTTELYDGIFEYNNTVGGYECLADRNSDIFFGAYPSQEQIDDATKQGTEFIYTPIGMEAFVFFVHKDNPVENLTTEQIQKIYTGEITNWKEVGGKNEPITAYQRNEGSGSQSMLLRFLDGKVPMEADTETYVGGMGGIIEKVADYRNKEGSIGFSFRFYVEGIIQNPDIKMIRVDGVAPTVENIQNGTYPITTSLYAVTWAGNDNENVSLLLNWILSPEGQEIIEKTGYVPIH